MRRILVICLLAILAFSLAQADTLRLRDGTIVAGTYLGGDARTIKMAVGDRIQTFDIRDVVSLEFGTTAATAKTSTAATTSASKERVTRSSASDTRVLRTERSAEASATHVSEGTVIPAGTPIVVRMIDAVDSEKAGPGDTFRATVDEPVVVNGKTVIPVGADVITKLVAEQEAGRLTGKTTLTLALDAIEINNQMVHVASQEVLTEGESRTRQTAERAGIGAAIGAVVGAIAGGGKGAAIGAATGAGAGTAIQIFTKGEKVLVPSETRLTFILKNDVIVE